MQKQNKSTKPIIAVMSSLLFSILMLGCVETPQKTEEAFNGSDTIEKPDYFLLRPELEKAYGYTQAVRVGNIV